MCKPRLKTLYESLLEAGLLCEEQFNEAEGHFIEGDYKNGIFLHGDGVTKSVYKDYKVVDTTKSDDADKSKTSDIKIDKKVEKELNQFVKDDKITKDQYNKLLNKELESKPFKKYGGGKVFKIKINQNMRAFADKDKNPLYVCSHKEYDIKTENKKFFDGLINKYNL